MLFKYIPQKAAHTAAKYFPLIWVILYEWGFVLQRCITLALNNADLTQAMVIGYGHWKLSREQFARRDRLLGSAACQNRLRIHKHNPHYHHVKTSWVV